MRFLKLAAAIAIGVMATSARAADELDIAGCVRCPTYRTRPFGLIATTDGRVLTGIIRAEDKDKIALVTANETITLPKNEIEERRSSEQSMMAEDLWKPLSEHEIRSLVAYLASPAQVALPAPETGRSAP